jgi:hypothetical protein
MVNDGSERNLPRRYKATVTARIIDTPSRDHKEALQYLI